MLEPYRARKSMFRAISVQPWQTRLLPARWRESCTQALKPHLMRDSQRGYQPRCCACQKVSSCNSKKLPSAPASRFLAISCVWFFVGEKKHIASPVQATFWRSADAKRSHNSVYIHRRTIIQIHRESYRAFSRIISNLPFGGEPLHIT